MWEWLFLQVEPPSARVSELTRGGEIPRPTPPEITPCAIKSLGLEVCWCLCTAWPILIKAQNALGGLKQFPWPEELQTRTFCLKCHMFSGSFPLILTLSAQNIFPRSLYCWSMAPSILEIHTLIRYLSTSSSSSKTSSHCSGHHLKISLLIKTTGGSPFQ